MLTPPRELTEEEKQERNKRKAGKERIMKADQKKSTPADFLIDAESRSKAAAASNAATADSSTSKTVPPSVQKDDAQQSRILNNPSPNGRIEEPILPNGEINFVDYVWLKVEAVPESVLRFWDFEPVNAEGIEMPTRATMKKILAWIHPKSNEFSACAKTGWMWFKDLTVSLMRTIPK